MGALGRGRQWWAGIVTGNTGTDALEASLLEANLKSVARTKTTKIVLVAFLALFTVARPPGQDCPGYMSGRQGSRLGCRGCGGHLGTCGVFTG